MWIATVTNVSKIDDMLLVEITYTNEFNKQIVETCKNYGDLSADWLSEAASQKIKQLESVEAAAVAVGSITIIDKTDPIRDSFIVSLKKLDRAWRLVEMGILSKDSKNLTDLMDAVRSNIDDYWSYI
jgi:hypothetical protein